MARSTESGRGSKRVALAKPGLAAQGAVFVKEPLYERRKTYRAVNIDASKGDVLSSPVEAIARGLGRPESRRRLPRVRGCVGESFTCISTRLHLLILTDEICRL